MNWSVDDGLYNRFIKWKMRCKNILDCELAMLSEARKCKNVIAWSGNFGLDQYICWNLSNEELCLVPSGRSMKNSVSLKLMN